MHNDKVKSKGKLWLGLSGLVLPGSKKTFPVAFQDKPRLAYYSSIFNSLEINSSFYKVPQLKTLLRWTTEVSSGFRFMIKLWKQITHVKELAFKTADIIQFMKATAIPGGHQGCLLIQLPGKITFEYYDKVRLLLSAIIKRNHVSNWTLCIEFRYKSWYNDKTLAMLSKLRVVALLDDMLNDPVTTQVSAGRFMYLRFHGPTGNYRGSYTDPYLKRLAQLANKWLANGMDVYIYFNNTIGSAFQNAVDLSVFIKKGSRKILT